MYNLLKRRLINDLREYGATTIVANRETKEMLNYSFSIDNNGIVPLTREDKDYVDNKIKEVRNYIDRCKKLLKDDINTRQAIVLFSQLEELPNCFISIQLLVRNKKLYCFCNSRSLDVENKLFTDIEVCRKICKEVCNELNVELEMIKFIVGSIHYYAKNNKLLA